MRTEQQTALDTFFDDLPFSPDAFQREALDSVAASRSVVVTAPTGAGKTLIAEGAIAMCVSDGRRAFYTTPIKALSNQKFADLRLAYGDDAVGLLTGDNVINGDAQIIVMTTEVLRNMIYSRSDALDRLGVVILDEVHYLADRNRGSVWEEVIIHLDRSVPIVCLSATIANAEEFTDWIRARRGDTDLITISERPVPLTSMYMWRDRNIDAVSMSEVFGPNGRPNPAITRLLERSKGRHRRFSTPRRTDVIEILKADDLLPMIYFVFSRKGCDQAAAQVASANLGLTSSDEQQEIRAIVESHVVHISPEDLVVLGYQRWLDILVQGAAAHHAGLVPAFKETVEELFLRGLVKMVAATETLALGINMPARTVVLESLSKFNGETHELLRPSDYTQLTGRAGRRGIDDHGTAIVMYSPYVPFDRVSAIAAAGSNPLRSSFTPIYNMAVNMIARYDENVADELLRASFANFTDAARTEQLAVNLAARERDVATFRDAAACDLGDIWALPQGGGRREASVADTSRLEPGAILEFSGATYALLARSWGGGRPRLELTDSSGQLLRMRSSDLPMGTAIVGSIKLPGPIRTRDAVYRREVAMHLETYVASDTPIAVHRESEDVGILGCPDLDAHIDWAARARRAERDVKRLRRRLNRTEADDIVTDFHKLHDVLQTLGYTNGWSLTTKGEQLRGLYNELDLLLVETLLAGTFDGLSVAEFAGLLTVFTYESRGGDVPQQPKAVFAGHLITEIEDIRDAICAVEAESGVPQRRLPDPGLVDIVHGWTLGLDLVELFEDEDIRAGDFVRSARQVLDLLRQVRDAFPEYRTIANDGIAAIDRGIVDGGRPQ